MKRFRFLLVAAVVFAMGSAFTTSGASAKESSANTYFAVYSDATHWTYTATAIPGNSCQPVSGRYCKKTATSLPAPNTPGDVLGEQYLP